MFGYVIPDKPNMLVKDLSEYRAYYCGLCKAIGKSYSEKARLLTNYDCTFLAAFLHNLYVEMPKFNDEVCILNPVKKKTVCVSEKSGLIIIGIRSQQCSRHSGKCSVVSLHWQKR